MMRAYFLQSAGERMNLELREAPTPQPAAHQHLVKIHASSLNRGELIAGHGLIAAGAAKPAGQEAAGEVVGSGERVMGRCPGGFAEFGLMDKSDAIPVPPNLSWEEAGAIPLTFMVVHDMLVAQGGLKAGEWLLVTGVSAGVGVAALQAAKAIGAKVIGTSGSAEKLQKLKAIGLDVGVETRKPDFYDAVMKATGGKGVDLVVNNVGGSVFAECIRTLAFQGRLATVGYLDRVMKAELDIDALHAKRLKLFGVSNKNRNAESRAVTVRGFVADFLPYFASGRLKPLVDRVYRFDELPQAKAFVESDAHLGKVVIRM
ncbi:MAG TPA: zinc-binding dehydrogenase [Burkholderiales bacterium]|jgi:NADPH:quinone reductase-like Zn-dependent oxidoreductase|nr:zinc-binding dehydrogenase [Burkholderiales bacterium]